VLFYPSWRGSHYKAFLHQLKHQMLHHNNLTSIIIFKVIVSSGTDVEDYCISHLRIHDLPVIVTYSKGAINSIIELQPSLHTNNSDAFFERTVSLTDFISYSNESAVDYIHIINELYNHIDFNILQSHNHHNSCDSMKVFISGDRSNVGKSSICLAILATLLRRGFSANSLAYIKPVTQCEEEQPITRFCNRNGILNRGIGPIVFYKGFTRAYLSNETDSSDVMMDQIVEAVEMISRGKLITIVDGVGYPSVGKKCKYIARTYMYKHIIEHGVMMLVV